MYQNAQDLFEAAQDGATNIAGVKFNAQTFSKAVDVVDAKIGDIASKDLSDVGESLNEVLDEFYKSELELMMGDVESATKRDTITISSLGIAGAAKKAGTKAALDGGDSGGLKGGKFDTASESKFENAGENKFDTASESKFDNADKVAEKTTANTKGDLSTNPNLSRGEQLVVNGKVGKEFENMVGNDLKATNPTVTEQHTFKVKFENGSSVRFRSDFAELENGKLNIIEVKSSQTASLTNNQKKAFDGINNSQVVSIESRSTKPIVDSKTGETICKGDCILGDNVKVNIIRPDSNTQEVLDKVRQDAINDAKKGIKK